MADSSDDPTTTTPAGPTQPVPVSPGRALGPDRRPGWRSGQVVVVAVLALLLGGAGATLAWMAADGGETDPTGTAVASTTTSTTSSATTDADRSTSIPTTTTVPSGGTSNSGDQGNQSQGETVVGNGIFTASYQSDGDRSTEDFEVDDDWKVRWDVPSGAVTIEVFDSGSTAADALVQTIQAQGRGEFVVAEGGTYRVDINADGTRYTVVITDGP